jgi:hypothetical protein
VANPAGAVTGTAIQGCPATADRGTTPAGPADPGLAGLEPGARPTPPIVAPRAPRAAQVHALPASARPANTRRADARLANVRLANARPVAPMTASSPMVPGANRRAAGSNRIVGRGTHRRDRGRVARVACPGEASVAVRAADRIGVRGGRRMRTRHRIVEVPAARTVRLLDGRHPAVPGRPGRVGDRRGRSNPAGGPEHRRRAATADRAGARPSPGRSRVPRQAPVHGPVRRSNQHPGFARHPRSPPRTCSGPTRNSSRVVARSRRSSRPDAMRIGCSSSRSGATRSNNSCCTPPGCASRSSRSRADR